MSAHRHGADLALSKIPNCAPLKILEIGPGLGYWGFKLKSTQDYEPHITGVELDPEYIERLNRLGLYDRIWAEDATELGGWTCSTYDLGFLSHVIEHIEKLKAITLIKELQKMTNQIILIVPEGNSIAEGDDPDRLGGPHVSQWRQRDLSRLGFKSQLVKYSDRAGRVVGYFETAYFWLKGMDRGGDMVAWWDKTEFNL